MYIRKKLNQGGSFSILLIKGKRMAGKQHPTPIVVRNFGSAKKKRDIEHLIKEAEEYKNHLEITDPKGKILKIASDKDITSCRSYNIGFNDIYGSIFDSTFSNLHLKATLMHQLRHLVIMRIAAPASKLKTTKLAVEYNINCKVDCIYKAMDLIKAPVIGTIKETIYEHTKQLLVEKKRTIDVLFYDLTTIYFETSTQDEIRNFGFSKDGKHKHVQIMLAVMVTTDGLPIDYKEFCGNVYEGHTLIPALNEIKLHYHVEKIVLVADAGLMNRINLQELDKRGIKYIISARIKNSKKEIKNEVLDIGSYTSVSKSMGDHHYMDEIKAKVIHSGEGDFLVAYHSTKRARKDEYDRQKDLERIERYLHSSGKNKLTAALKKSYIKVDKNCKVEINQKKLDLEKQYDGFFGLRTNIEQINPLEFLSSYRGLWQVEQTFRISKSALRIRPVFHYSPRRIRAHLAICYMALALVRYVEFKLKTQKCETPHERLHLLLDRMRTVKITDYKNDLFEFAEDPPQELIPIYHALKIKWPQKFGYRPNL